SRCKFSYCAYWLTNYCYRYMKNSIVLIFLALLLSQCEGEFTPDPTDPRLPRYSEEGKDAAGCFINGNLWRAVRGVRIFGRADEDLRVEFFPKDSIILLTLDGHQRELTDSLGIHTEISFTLDNRQLQSTSVESISPQTFVLDGKQNYARLTQESEGIIANHGTGQLTIRHNQLDPENETERHNYYTVAGTFSFTATSDSLGTIEVKNGRFDYSVRERKSE
ncbi:MAG: hypothetical protein AAF223_17975, partial [Bacteroidota bacterium]